MESGNMETEKTLVSGVEGKYVPPHRRHRKTVVVRLQSLSSDEGDSVDGPIAAAIGNMAVATAGAISSRLRRAARKAELKPLNFANLLDDPEEQKPFPYVGPDPVYDEEAERLFSESLGLPYQPAARVQHTDPKEPGYLPRGRCLVCSKLEVCETVKVPQGPRIAGIANPLADWFTDLVRQRQKAEVRCSDLNRAYAEGRWVGDGVLVQTIQADLLEARKQLKDLNVQVDYALKNRRPRGGPSAFPGGDSGCE